MSDKPTRFKITGMDCAEEVMILRRDVGPLVGGEENLSFDILNGIMTVKAAARESIDQAAIAKSVAASGMTAIPIAASLPMPPLRSRW